MGKKIVFVIGSLKKGGAERNLALVASNFAENGFIVYIILYENVIEFALHSSIIIINLDIMRVPAGIKRIYAIYKGIKRNVWEINPHYAIAFTRLSSQFLAISFFPNIIARYDIYPFYMKKRRWITSLILFNLPNVKKVVSPSYELKDKLRSYFINKNKLVVINNPVIDIKRIDIKSEKTVLPYFIVVGRLASQKRVDLIIEAFATSKAVETFKLLILGEGRQESKLKSKVKELHIENRVEFMGFVDNPYNLIKDAKCLILASDREGFPNVLVEALSLGTPVITSTCPTGPREIVTDRYNGLLFSVGNKKQLSKAIDEIAFDSELYSLLLNNAVCSVKKFEINEIMSKWQELVK